MRISYIYHILLDFTGKYGIIRFVLRKQIVLLFQSFILSAPTSARKLFHWGQIMPVNRFTHRSLFLISAALVLSVLVGGAPAAAAKFDPFSCDAALSVHERADCLTARQVGSAPAPVALVALPEARPFSRAKEQAIRAADASRLPQNDGAAGLSSLWPLLLFGAAFVGLYYLSRHRGEPFEDDL